MTGKPVIVVMVGLALGVGIHALRKGGASAEAAPTIRVSGAAEAGGSMATAGAGSTSPLPTWSDDDRTLFLQRVRWALNQRLDTLPMGETVAAIGQTFVGTPYVPHTLEADGPEHLVIDFRELDCVTFVETALTLARFVHESDARTLVEVPSAAEARYDALLTGLRYRGGHLDGYPSRLHYFTDWIDDAQEKGLVENVTRSLGGVRDDEPVDFMSTHVDAYRQLREDSSNVTAIRAAEARLSAEGRWYIPQDRVAEEASGIRDGDVIAATSTVEGLDVAHTGIALWKDGTLRLMHAPLVGDSVQISPEPLADRLKRISGQDGIIVARPLEARPCGAAPTDAATPAPEHTGC